MIRRQSGTWLRTCFAAAALACLAALPAHAIDKVVFSVAGGDDKLTDRLVSASALVSQRERGNDDPQELIAAARSDYARMIGVLWNAGFLGATVNISVDGTEAADLSLVDVPDSVTRFRYVIRTGPPYRFGDLALGPLTPETELPKGFARGETAALSLAADAADAAIDGWRDAGHPKPTVSNQRIVADHRADQVDIEIALSPGPQATLGTATVTGNREVRTERVAQIMGFPTGEPYSPAAVRAAGNRLRQTGTFRSVTLTPSETINPDGTLDYQVTVAEGKKRRIGAGVEYSNTDGIEFSFNWLHRNVSGGAERLELGGVLSNIGAANRDPSLELRGRYTIPGFREWKRDFFAFGDLARLDERDYFGYATSAGVGVLRRINEVTTTELALGLGFTVFDNAFGNDRENVLLFLRSRTTHDTRDDIANPASGYYVDAILEPYLMIEGGDSGLRFRADTRAYRGFRDDRFVLAGRFQLGSIAGTRLEDMPSNLLFYSGGGGTVRGREFEGLGSSPPSGRSGGRSFMNASAELRAGVTDAITAVGFFDWGYVGAESFPDGSGDTHAGAGIGVRYNTPIGPLRVDLAVPVGSPPEPQDVFLYIGVGQAF